MNNNDSGIETTDVRLEGAVEEDTKVLSEGHGDAVSRFDAPADQAPTIAVPQEDPTAKEQEERSWAAPIAIGVFVVVAIAVAAILLLSNAGNENTEGSRRTGGRGGTQQAEWKINSYSLGGKHPSAKPGNPPKDEARSLENLVRRWHDSVYLFPADLRADTQKYFTAAAAGALRGSDLGLPDSAKQIETKKRTARIGIEADGAKRAAAVVEIVATGDSAKGPFRTTTETRLWLEREGAKWNVVAFDVEQRPLPLEPKNEGPKKDGAKDNGPASKNDGKPKDGGKK